MMSAWGLREFFLLHTTKMHPSLYILLRDNDIIDILGENLLLTSFHFTFLALEVPSAYSLRELKNKCSPQKIHSLTLSFERYMNLAFFWTFTSCLIAYSRKGLISFYVCLCCNLLYMTLIYCIYRREVFSLECPDKMEMTFLPYLRYIV